MIIDSRGRNGRFSAALHTTASIPAPDTSPLFGAGDTVMHPSEGVCTIATLQNMEIGSAGKRNYYILKPCTEKSSSTVYLPIARGNEILRRLLTKEDILALIRRSKQHDALWIEDSKQRREAFSHILCEGDYAKIIRMIQELHEDRIRREASGKKPCAADEAILCEAERLLHQEFSCVLRLSIGETAAFVRRELGV